RDWILFSTSGSTGLCSAFGDFARSVPHSSCTSKTGGFFFVSAPGLVIATHRTAARKIKIKLLTLIFVTTALYRFDRSQENLFPQDKKAKRGSRDYRNHGT